MPTVFPTPSDDTQRLTRNHEIPAHLPAPAHWPGWATELDPADPPMYVRVIHDGALCRAEVVQVVAYVGAMASPVTVHVDTPGSVDVSDLPALAADLNALWGAVREAHHLLTGGGQ